MAENKKSFTAYCDWNTTFNALPDEKAGQLIKHLFAYVNDENPTTEDLLINAVFANIKATLKRDLIKWTDRSEKNRASVIERWNKIEQQKIQNNTNVYERIKSDTFYTDSVSDSDSDIVITTNNKNENFKNECLASEQWIEVVAMREKIPIEKFNLALEDFNGHLISTGENKQTLNDYKYHFVMWVKKRKQLKAKEETNINTGKL